MKSKKYDGFTAEGFDETQKTALNSGFVNLVAADTPNNEINVYAQWKKLSEIYGPMSIFSTS